MKTMTDERPVALLTMERVRLDINTFLAGYLEEQIQAADVLSAQYGRMWQAISELNQAGGKRFRPYMLLLAYQSFGGSDSAAVVPVAAAWEMLHLSMLIHDDIIDNDLIRYGVKNVAGKYRDVYGSVSDDQTRVHHLASGAAVLAGDLALSAAHELVISSDLSAESKIRTIRCLTDAIFAVAGGELLDTEAVLYPMLEADPMQIAMLKSASYSFVGPLLNGALLAHASADQIEQLERFAEILGLAFQLTDDLLGIFGDARLTGKSTIGDISEGKRTYLMQQAYRNATPEQAGVLAALVGKPELSDDDAELVREVLIKTGARQYTQHLIESYREQATEIVAGLLVPAEYKGLLQDLISTVTDRSF